MFFCRVPTRAATHKAQPTPLTTFPSPLSFPLEHASTYLVAENANLLLEEEANRREQSRELCRWKHSSSTVASPGSSHNGKQDTALHSSRDSAGEAAMARGGRSNGGSAAAAVAAAGAALAMVAGGAQSVAAADCSPMDLQAMNVSDYIRWSSTSNRL